MTILAATAVVFAVVMGMMLVRTWRRIRELDEEVRLAINERDVLASEAVAARGQAHAAKRERDEVHGRFERGQQDAADVASRLRDETVAREEAEAAAESAVARLRDVEDELEASRARLLDDSRAREDAEEATARLAEVEAELESARDSSVPLTVVRETGDDPSFEVMWALALARVERLWATSISLGFDGSPLVESEDQLRTAVEIMIDAAREEAGADIELHWSGDAPAPPRAAVVALEVIEAAVAAVAKAAWTTEVSVTVSEAAVEVQFDALDDAGDIFVVGVPAALSEAPNHIRIPISGAAPDHGEDPEASDAYG